MTKQGRIHELKVATGSFDDSRRVSKFCLISMSFGLVVNLFDLWRCLEHKIIMNQKSAFGLRDRNLNLGLSTV